MPRHYFYWLVGKDPVDGQPFLVRGGNTEEEARQKGLEMLGGVDFTIRRLPTVDQSTASAMIRGKRLEETHNVHEARRPQMHERSVARMRRRLEARRRYS